MITLLHLRLLLSLLVPSFCRFEFSLLFFFPVFLYSIKSDSQLEIYLL